jgi:hypothetical protein
MEEGGGESGGEDRKGRSLYFSWLTFSEVKGEGD